MFKRLQEPLLLELLDQFPAVALLGARQIGKTPVLERGFHHAREDLQPARSLVVCDTGERFPLGDGIEAVGPADLGTLFAS